MASCVLLPCFLLLTTWHLLCGPKSGCGNYGLVGTRGGHVFRYNMQSGEPRGSYPQSATPTPKAVKALTNVMKPGSIVKITEGGFSSKQIGVMVWGVIFIE